jgi:hypothetical protein
MEQRKLRKLRCRFVIRSVPCVQLGLITVLGNCGCVAVASFLGVPSALLFISAMAILLTFYGKYYNIKVHNLQGTADF